MNTEIYEYAIDDNDLLYTFYSRGKNTTIKVVIYQKAARNHFNLAFGDYDEVKDEVSDISVTNNGDTIKVLGTVIETIQTFFKAYPYAILDVRGSTISRTKLYQKIIRDNWAKIETEFKILAFMENDYQPELPNFSKEYTAFQIYRK